MRSEKSGSLPGFAWPLFLLLGAIAIFLLSAPDPFPEAETPVPPQMYSSAYQLIGTGNRLGTYFPAGNVLADWFNSHFSEKGGVFKAVETNGSIDNVRLLKEHGLMMGMVESRIVKEAFAASASSTLRLVWPLWLDVVHFVKTPSIYESINEFPGRFRGFLGQKKSSTFRTSQEILAALGITQNYGDLELATDAVLAAVSTGQIGFATIQSGIPNRTVSDALNFRNCTLVNFNNDQLEKIVGKVSTSQLYVIPAGFYSESQPEIHTIGLPNVLVANSETSAETIELITELLVKGATHLKMRHQAIAAVPFDPEKALAIMSEIGVPLHQGTQNWLAKNLPVASFPQSVAEDSEHGK